MRQLSHISGHSMATIKRIKNYWLARKPPEEEHLGDYKYLLFDGTYFHIDGCLILVMDAISGKVIRNRYVERENGENALAMFSELKNKGLSPKAVIVDGCKPVMVALREVWTGVLIQRCLYHIQHEGMRWLRSYPKSLAGQELRRLLRGLSGITTRLGCEQFLGSYDKWLRDHAGFLKTLDSKIVAQKDLKKTRALINNARTDMFHFLDDKRIESTTNKLEGFFSRLKSDYRRHRGLTKAHRIAFLEWYCYFQNQQISTTF